jgi:hypothetical protein
MNWYFINEGVAAPTERSWTKIRFMDYNLWDTGTLTSSSELDDFPATNTRQRWHHKCWRSDDTEDTPEQWLKVDLGVAQDIRAFVVKQHWFLPSATVKIQANATDSWGSPSLDESLVTCDPLIPIVKFWDSAQNYRWWRLSMNADYDKMQFKGDWDSVPYCVKYYRAGRIYLGEFWEPSSNFAAYHTLKSVDETRRHETIDGQKFSYKVNKYTHVRYEFKMLTEADIANFEDMFDNVGRSVPLFVCENEKYWWRKTFYCTFISDFEILREGIDCYTLIIKMETMR